MKRCLLLCFITITLLLIRPMDSTADVVDGPAPHISGQGPDICGGVGGISCPDGYFCEYPEPRYPDAQGVCKPQNSSVMLEYDTDRPGSDYRHFEMTQGTPELCRAVCVGDPPCKAFTYVKPGVQGPKARCWLKQAVPQAGPSSCCVSGVKAGGMLPPTPTGQSSVLNCPPGTTAWAGQCVPVGPPPGVQPPVVNPSGHPLGINCPPGTTVLAGQCVSMSPPRGVPPPPPLGPANPGNE